MKKVFKQSGKVDIVSYHIGIKNSTKILLLKMKEIFICYDSETTLRLPKNQSKYKTDWLIAIFISSTKYLFEFDRPFFLETYNGSFCFVLNSNIKYTFKLIPVKYHPLMRKPFVLIMNVDFQTQHLSFRQYKNQPLL